VTVSAKMPYGPYYDTLSEEQKQWLRDHPGSNDAISRNIIAQATQGYGVDGNQSFTESTGDMVNKMLGAGPTGAMAAMQAPQSFMTEAIQDARGLPHNYMDAINPLLGKTGNQRFPSDVFMDPDSHWAAKMALDMFTDPASLLPAGMIDNALGLGIRKGIGAGVRKGVRGAVHEPLGKLAQQAPQLSKYIPYSDYMKRMGISKQDWENFNKLPLERKQQWISALQEGYANPALHREGMLGLPDWNQLGDKAQEAFAKNYLHVKDPKVGLGAHINDPAADILSNPQTGLTLEKTHGGFAGSRNLTKRKTKRQGLFDYLLDPQGNNLTANEVYQVSYSNPKNWRVNDIYGNVDRGKKSFRGKLDTGDKTLSHISFFEDSKIAAGKAVQDIKNTMPKGYTLQEDLLTGDSYSAIMKTMNKAGKKDPNQFTPIFRGENFRLGDSGKFTPLSKQIAARDKVRDELSTTMRKFRNNNEVDPISGLPPKIRPGMPLRGRTIQNPFTTEQTNELNRLASLWRNEANKAQDMAYDTYNETRKMYPNANLPELKPDKINFKKSDAATAKAVKEGHLLPVLDGGKNYPNVSWKKNYRYGGYIPYNNQINLDSSTMNQTTPNTNPTGYYPVGQPNYYAQGGELPQHAFPVALLAQFAPQIIKGMGNLFEGKGLFGNKKSRKERKAMKRQKGTPLAGDLRNYYQDPMYGYMDYFGRGNGYRHRGPYGGSGGNNWMSPDVQDMYASVGQAPSMYATGGELPQHFLGGMFGGGGQGGGGRGLLFGGLREKLHSWEPHNQFLNKGQQQGPGNSMNPMAPGNGGMFGGNYGQNFGSMNPMAPGGGFTGMYNNWQNPGQWQGSGQGFRQSPSPHVAGQRQGGGGMSGYEQGGNLPQHGFGSWLQSNVFDPFNNATGMVNYSPQNLANAAQTNFDNAQGWSQSNVFDPINNASGTKNYNPFNPQGAQQQNSIFGGSGHNPLSGALGGLGDLWGRTWGNIFSGRGGFGGSGAPQSGAPQYGANTNWDDYWNSYWQSNPHAYSYRGPQYNSAPPGSGWNRNYGNQGNYGPRQGYNMGAYAQGGDIPKNIKFVDEDHEGEDKEFEAGEVYKGKTPVFATRPENGVMKSIGNTDMAVVEGTGKYGKHSVQNPKSGHTGTPVKGGEGGFVYSNQTMVDDDTWKQANSLFSGTLPS